MRLCRNELKRVVGVGAEYRADMEAGATLGLGWHLSIARSASLHLFARGSAIATDAGGSANGPGAAMRPVIDGVRPLLTVPGQGPGQAPSHGDGRRRAVTSATSIRAKGFRWEGRPWRGASDARGYVRRSRLLPGLKHPSKVPQDRSRGGAGDRLSARRRVREEVLVGCSRSRGELPAGNAGERRG
jgi:hypothetical protein